MEKFDKRNKEEILLALMNILATEEHLLEMVLDDAQIQKRILANDLLNVALIEIRAQRNMVIKFLFSDKEKENLKSLWCVLKHSILAYQHLLESINKEDDYQQKVEIMITAKKQKIFINNIFELLNKNEKFKECKICSNDLLNVLKGFNKKK